VAVSRIALVGEQTPHVEITPAGQGCPDHLVAQAGDPDGVGAGEGQHRLERIGGRLGRLE